MRLWLLLLFCLLTVVPQGFAAQVVLFDEGHGQPFHVRGNGSLDLSQLAERFATNGFEVRTTTSPLDDESLDGVTALVISGAFRPFSSGELAAVQTFLNEGGNVAVMLHIAPPLGSVLELLKVDYANGILHDGSRAIDNNPQYIRVGQLASHPLTEGLVDFAVYGCWALRGTAPPVEPVAWTSVQGWVDLVPDGQLGSGDARGPFAVAVAGHAATGRYVVFGDDAIFQNRFLIDSNRHLADNLVRWLSRGKSYDQMELKLHN
jgi:hypothetical protein